MRLLVARASAFALSAAFAFAVPGPAVADAAETDTVHRIEQTSWVGHDPCSGEPIQWSGTSTLVEHVTVDAAGREIRTVHSHETETGVGLTSGTRYIRLSGDTGGWRDAPGDYGARVIWINRVIAQGPANDWGWREVYHARYEPGGKWKQFFDYMIVDSCEDAPSFAFRFR